MNPPSISVTPQVILELREKAAMHEGRIVVGTHDGSWHPDELLAIAVIQEALPEIHVSVIRSRNPDVLKDCDILVDIGNGMFDHHQDVETYQNGIQKAACGKVLEAFENDQVLKNYLLWDLFYSVEAEDNGMHYSHIPKELPPNKLSFVRMFNSTWMERTGPVRVDPMRRFYEVLDLVRTIYKRARAQAQARIAAKRLLAKAETYMNGRFIYLPDGGLNWQQYAYTHSNLLGAIYRSETGLHWVVRVAKENPIDLFNRVEFPTEWAGLEGKKLEEVSHIPGASFCHKNLFIATFKTKEGAEQAARVLAGKYRFERGKGALPDNCYA